MLSVLIPVYNFNVTSLVDDLHRQLSALAIDFEIIATEDGSTQFLNENQSVENLQFVQYNVLDKNIGRAAIRNLLAECAKYDYLLFLDCDIEICNDNFIGKYLKFCQKDSVVLGGRTIYRENREKNCSLMYKYSQKKEQFNDKILKIRQKYSVFTSPNFLIYRNIFKHVQFDEAIKEYGHEDTIFGLMLNNAGYKFTYIDNPVINNGLEDNQKYIQKTETALNTLFKIYKSNKYPQLKAISKIISLFVFCEKIRINKVISKLFLLFKKLIVGNLTSEKPSLFLFDCYKLGYFCGLKP
jgi:cellulose synthase/poly-beta-1,6-N-acetylglucosamine synthase-like glycosyltransferase